VVPGDPAPRRPRLLWLVFVVLTVVAFFAILVTSRYPRGLFDLNVGILRWTWRVQFYATAAIGTDRYSPFTLDHTDYPADLDITYPKRLSRGLVLVKSWLLALPHLIGLGVLAGTWQFGDADGFQFAVGGLIGALTLAVELLLFTGRYPAPLFDLLVGLNRWVYRVTAYIALMTDTYPPFRLDQDPADPDGVAPPPSTPDASATTGLGWPAGRPRSVVLTVRWRCDDAGPRSQAPPDDHDATADRHQRRRFPPPSSLRRWALAW
jgi:hypothetical protein